MTHNPFAPDVDAPLCKTCSTLDIDRMLRKGVPQARAIPLGPLSRILSSSSSCGLCMLISTAIRHKWLLDKHPDVDLAGVQCQISSEPCGGEVLSRASPHRLYIIAEPRPTKIYHAQHAAGLYLPVEIQLLEDDAVKFGRDPIFHGRRVGELVGVDRLKGWVTLCEKGHGSDCEDVWWWKGKDDGLPAGVRVIDVVDMKLVDAPPNCQFVSLSYLWGGPGDAYWTTMANLDSRQKSKGLDISILPGTIADAIQLVEQLGERYLWVDALCIVQDAWADKMAQIKVMDLIYGASVLTIFAAGGSTAHAPLPGLRPGTRTVRQIIQTINGLRLAVPLPTLGESIAKSFWSTRGWTYQERMLSRRRIYFTSDQVFYECRRDIWSEDLIAENDSRHASYPAKYNGRSSLNFPHGYSVGSRDTYIERYMGIVSEYTLRELTNESDIVHAITAVTNVFAKGFESKKGEHDEVFRFGIPLLQLEHALLWQPTQETTICRRSIPSVTMPSWSWAGWRGGAQYRTVGFNANVAGCNQSFITEWGLAGPDGKTRILDIERVGGSYVGSKEEEMKRPRYKGVHYSVDPNTQPKTIPTHDEPGTLIFYTPACKFPIAIVPEVVSTDSVPYMSSVNSVFSIFSNSTPAARIGRIILPTSAPTSAPLEFIVLSRAKGSYLDSFDESVFGKQYYGCVLNVMAVSEGADGTRERLGVGVTFEGIWNGKEVNEVMVRLR